MSPHESIIVGLDATDAVARAAEVFLDALARVSRLTDPRPAFVALAGGRTPQPLYHSLTQLPLRDRWDPLRVEWFWSDERCVPPDHPDSNYGMAHRTLLEPLQVPADRIHRMPADADDLQAAAARYESTIRQRVPSERGGPPVFDLILLGMGADGHTASLFPGSPAVQENQRLIIAQPVQQTDSWRMTMTYPLLHAARHLLLLVTGPDKAEALAAARAPTIDTVRCPAAGLRQGTADITWVLDPHAARLVQRRPLA